MNSIKRVSAMTLLAFLAGCANNVKTDFSNGESIQFTVPYSYETAYRLATEYARGCHGNGEFLKTTHNFDVEAELFPDIKTGWVRIGSNGGIYKSTAEQIKVTAQTDHSTLVQASNVGHRPGMWDMHELETIKRSLESQRVVCKF